MIYVDINDIRKPFRNALENDNRVNRWSNYRELMQSLGEHNNCKIVGQGTRNGWTTDGIEFPDEKSYMLFLLKWSK